MKAILFVLAMGTVAAAVVEAVERWRRCRTRKNGRASIPQITLGPNVQTGRPDS
jgi:hypothetical protein